MGALSEKTVLLVTHQVDFLPAFDSILVSNLIILNFFITKTHHFGNHSKYPNILTVDV